MPEELAGKTAIVTGASRGIGAATAIALAEAGVRRLVIQYNSYRKGAEQVLARVEASGGEGAAIQADLTSPEGISKCVRSLGEDVLSCDILVNNAGSLVQRAPLTNCPLETYDQVMNLNVRSVWELSQAVAPGMIERRSGVIVNVSSIAARTGGGPGATLYAAAKAAVSAMTRGMAKALAPHGIRVNAISPGTVDNHFHELLDRVVSATPLGRLATNEEMADTVLYLCSNASSYVIGQTIELNGGMYMV